MQILPEYGFIAKKKNSTGPVVCHDFAYFAILFVSLYVLSLDNSLQLIAELSSPRFQTLTTESFAELLF
jgi:hypothetical protein